jgi:hypothetical protein
MHTADVIDGVGTAIEIVGVAIMVIGAIAATAAFLIAVWRQHAFRPMYQAYRRGLGALSCSDSSSWPPTSSKRSPSADARERGRPRADRPDPIALSFSPEVEIDGHWPWQATERSRDRQVRPEGPTP